MEQFGFSMLWYWVAYIIVTLIGMGEGYEKTKPWHPLYNIIVFPIFAMIYFSGLGRWSADE